VISVIIPSRLQQRIGAADGTLWLDQALAQVARQEAGLVCEVIVGIDPNAVPPPRFDPALFRHAAAPGQASALNAAIAAARGEFLAILEDDDGWAPCKLREQMRHLERYDIVTAGQLELDSEGTQVGERVFATPSGWLMRRTIFDRVGAFDPAFRYRLDNEWLGRANAVGLHRIHLLSRSAIVSDPLAVANVAKRSAVMLGPESCSHLVFRTVNPNGGTTRTNTEEEAAQRSRQEYALLVDRFGEIPW